MVHALPVLDTVSPEIVKAFTDKLADRCAFDLHHRGLYATDASLYQVMPLGVVFPATVDDVLATLALCNRYRLPILPRGGGTSLAGQCTNRAIVIDFSRNMRKLLSVDATAQSCHAQPGIALDEMNRQIVSAGHKLFFAADPATSAQAAVGGCIGNNAAGARSLRYGRTAENVAGIELLLTDGRTVKLHANAGASDPSARKLAQQMIDLIAPHAELIRQRYPHTNRRNAGYGLDMLVKQLDAGAMADTIDLSPLICGSEGTLGIVLSATLKLNPIPAGRGLAVASFASVEEAIDRVQPILQTNPTALELLDDVVLDAAAGNNECRAYLDLLPKSEWYPVRGVLYIEYQADNDLSEISASFDRLRQVLGDVPTLFYDDKPAMLKAWALRKAGEPLLHGLPGARKPVTFVEDNAVPVENLPWFVREFRRIVEAHGTSAAFWAHASVGVLHVRPMINLHDPQDLARLRSIAVQVADLARDCGGVMSGEHGDGKVRGPLLERFYGPQIVELFRRTKQIFDPGHLLNPGTIVDAGPIESITQNLRLHHETPTAPLDKIDTYYDYSGQHGFWGAVDQCNGAGVCRKTSGGAMCPSYRATLDERHSTRGRANALRLSITGQFDPYHRPRWDDAPTMHTLDLCLSCKACKSECPSNVDVTKLKAEYTAQRYRSGGSIPLSTRVFGHVRTLNRIGSIAPGLANFVSNLKPVRTLLNYLLKLAPQRSLPPFAPSLHKWFKNHQQPADTHRPAVLLYSDCFTTYNEPHIGQAAVQLLEALGYRVLFPHMGCCGRSMISLGLLDDAIATADRTLAQLQPYIDDPDVRAVVVLEPSCLSAMLDDWQELKLNTPKEQRRRLKNKAMLIEQFVDRFWDAHPTHPTISQTDGPPVLFHGHCHQKALWGSESSAAMLRRFVGQRLQVLDTTCCGMAGSYGFAAHRYDLSMAVGEVSLFPLMRQAPDDAVVLTTGTSCRHQIRDGMHQESLHPVEYVAQLLTSNAQ